MAAGERYFLRRVHVSQINGEEIFRGAFTPTSEDIDGISFYDAEFVTADQLKASARKPATEYRVLAIPESAILGLGLSLEETEDLSPIPLPGHYVVPEFTIETYRDPKQKPRLKQAQWDLVQAAHFAD